MHEKKTAVFLQHVHDCEKIDPDYLLVLMKHAPTVMFQVQLTRHKDHQAFYQASRMVDQKVDYALMRLWTDFLTIPTTTDVAMRYYYMVRDMFYTRISFENLNYDYLHHFAAEAKALVTQMVSVNRRDTKKSS